MSCKNPNKRYIITPAVALLKGEKGEKGEKGDSNGASLSSAITHDGVESNGKTVKELLDKLLYTELSINSFTTSKYVYEKGQVLTSIDLAWSLNKTITSQTITGTFVVEPTLTAAQRSATIDLSNANTGFSITLTTDDGSGNPTKSKDVNVFFQSGVYYGPALEPASYDSAFINSLNKKLQTSRDIEFVAEIGSNQYGYVCYPTAYNNSGSPSFFINGFGSSMDEIATIQFTNDYGLIEEYVIYRTEYSGLGSTTIKVD